MILCSHTNSGVLIYDTENSDGSGNWIRPLWITLQQDQQGNTGMSFQIAMTFADPKDDRIPPLNPSIIYYTYPASGEVCAMYRDLIAQMNAQASGITLPNSPAGKQVLNMVKGKNRRH